MAINCMNRGFPLCHRQLKEHVDEIVRARWGDKFPADCVDKQWTRQFVSNYKELSTYWSVPLEKLRPCTVNPMTKEHYFDLLE
jgi:hypothetical protein